VLFIRAPLVRLPAFAPYSLVNKSQQKLGAALGLKKLNSSISSSLLDVEIVHTRVSNKTLRQYFLFGEIFNSRVNRMYKSLISNLQFDCILNLKLILVIHRCYCLQSCTPMRMQ
jgi:hypothetical protein